MLSRTRLAARIRAKLSPELGRSGVERAILRLSRYAPEERALALAITRVELANRTASWRIVEYTYLLLRLPGWRQVTAGSIQLNGAALLSAVPCCKCAQRRPRIWHFLSCTHQAHAVIAHVATLRDRLSDHRRVANAYNKGGHYPRLFDQTMYSEVVCMLAADAILMLTRPNSL